MDFSNKKISKKQKFVNFLKTHYSAIIIGCVVFALILTGIILAATTKGESQILSTIQNEEVSAAKIDWGFPVDNVEIIKPYNDKELQYNSTFNRWEAHKAIDFKAGETDNVKSVMNGTVVSVTKDLINGNVVVIEHANGITTSYGSLADDVTVKVGDTVKKGTVIGHGGTSASNESSMESHVHFEVKLKGKLVDPSKYIKF